MQTSLIILPNPDDLIGIAGIILDVHEGFENIPRKLGSTVRERGPVDNFQTGVVEGGKGLWYGWWDGITGLATEPLEGGKKEVIFVPTIVSPDIYV